MLDHPLFVRDSRGWSASEHTSHFYETFISFETSRNMPENLKTGMGVRVGEGKAAERIKKKKNPKETNQHIGGKGKKHTKNPAAIFTKLELNRCALQRSLKNNRKQNQKS